jgi:GNAT superfamily N-acetyltransferase
LAACRSFSCAPSLERCEKRPSQSEEERDGIAAEPPVDLDRIAQRTDLEQTLVAVSADELVGFLFIGEQFGCGELGMMVARAWRGRGVGSALVAAIVDWARARGLHKLALGVFPHNEAAVALYRKFGFVEEGGASSTCAAPTAQLWDSSRWGCCSARSARIAGVDPARR